MSKYLQWPRLFSGRVHEGLEWTIGNGFGDGAHGFGNGGGIGKGVSLLAYNFDYNLSVHTGAGPEYGKGRGHYYGGLDV